MKVVIAEPVKQELVELIKRNKKDWVVYDDFPKDKQDFINRVKDADIACSYYSKYDAEVLANSPRLKYLAIPAVGAEISVDMGYAKEHGVTVMNCPGYNSLAVAELALGLAIDVSRSISFLNSRLKSGIWANGEQINRIQISDKAIALIGYGNVGKSIHNLLKGWCSDFNIINSESSANDIDFVISNSDYIFVCCSLNSSTTGLISEHRLKMMKKTAVIVNVSRGAVVDENALYQALADKRIAGAGLDVFINEPFEQGTVVPDNISRFIKLDNVVCSPHVGASTHESGAKLSQMIYENIEGCINGKPKNKYKG